MNSLTPNKNYLIHLMMEEKSVYRLISENEIKKYYPNKTVEVLGLYIILESDSKKPELKELTSESIDSFLK